MKFKSIAILAILLSFTMMTIAHAYTWTETLVVEGGKSLHWSPPKNCSKAVLKPANWLNDELIVTDLTTDTKYTLGGKRKHKFTAKKGSSLLLENENALNFSISVTYYSK